MGQCQFGRDGGPTVANENKAQKKRKPLRSQKSDDPYILAISNPIFLDWEHRVNRKWKTLEEKQKFIDNCSAQHTNFPIQICDYLFLSNASGVINIARLRELGITHVLNVGGPSAAYLPEEAYTEAGINYRLEPDALDEPDYPMLDKHLQDSQDFIGLARSQQYPPGKCVVHCQAGSNRSGVIVAATFMLASEMNVLETISHCRKKRGNAFLTNPGFAAQLVALARQERRLGPALGAPNCVVEQFLWRKFEKENGNR